MSYASEWGEVFNKAAAIYSRDMKATKTGDKALAAFLDEQLDPVYRPLALLASLSRLDKISLAAGNDRDRAALAGNVKLFAAELKKAEAAVKAYAKACDEGLKLKPTVKNEKSLQVTPTPLKDLLPDTYRHLKLLKTEAEALLAKAANACKMAANTAKNEAVDQAKAKAMGKAGNDEDKRKQINEDAAMEKFVNSVATTFKSGMAKGAHGIQKIKADPTLANYNVVMNGLARDISQNLNNIAKFKSSSMAKKLADPGALARDITPYANGNLRNLPPGTPDADVAKHLKNFTTLYKDIATAYKALMDGKLG